MKKKEMFNSKAIVIAVITFITVTFCGNAWAELLLDKKESVHLLSDNLSSNRQEEKQIDLIEITDFHGYLEDEYYEPIGAMLAKNIRDIQKANPLRTIVIGGGDLYDGAQISTFLKGVPVRKMMDSLGMEATALGNHEWNWSLDTINNVTMRDANYSIICANIYNVRTQNRVYEPYKIIVRDGIRIAVIGTTTYKIRDLLNREKTSEYVFTDPIEEINKIANEIRQSKQADVVISLMHEGGMVGFDGSQRGPIFDIAKKLNGVDAVIGGDSHTIVNASVNGMPVVIGGCDGGGFMHLKINIDRNNKVSFVSKYVSLDTKNSYGNKSEPPLVDAEVNDIILKAEEEAQPFMDRANKISFGETIVTEYAMRNEFEAKGYWKLSSIPGVVAESMYVDNDMNAYAKWTPRVLAGGIYDVYIYNIVKQGSDPSAKVEIKSSEGIDYKYINQDIGETSWVYLGKYNFNKGQEGYVKITSWSDNTALRADSIKLVNKNVSNLENAIILKLNKSICIINGKIRRVDKNNTGIKPILEGGRTLLPLRFVAESLGAVVSWIDKTSSVRVELNDNSIEFVIGSNKIKVNSTVNEIDVPAKIIDGRTFVPFRALGEALGKIVTYIDGGIIIIDDKEIPNNEENRNLLNEIIK